MQAKTVGYQSKCTLEDYGDYQIGKHPLHLAVTLEKPVALWCLLWKGSTGISAPGRDCNARTGLTRHYRIDFDLQTLEGLVEHACLVSHTSY